MYTVTKIQGMHFKIALLSGALIFIFDMSFFTIAFNLSFKIITNFIQLFIKHETLKALATVTG